jgi:hypothetical protein
MAPAATFEHIHLQKQASTLISVCSILIKLEWSLCAKKALLEKFASKNKKPVANMASFY